MYLKTLDDLFAKVRGDLSPKKIAVADAGDKNTLQAVFKAKAEGVIDPLLIGDVPKIQQIMADLGETLPKNNFFHTESSDDAAIMAVRLSKEGAADILMKGKLHTASMMRAVVDKENGIVKSGNVLSLFTISQLPKYHKLLASSDAGIVPNPTYEQKVSIVRNAVTTLNSLGYEKPKVAILAAVEEVNPKMQETVDAAAISELNRTGKLDKCIIEGPLSMDIALNAKKAKIKGYEGQVPGDVDLLIWPNVVTGNITQKALVEFAGLKNMSVTVGAQVPIVTTSRGATIEQKYSSIIFAVATATKS